MTTSAQIREAWETYVFEHASIQAITDKYYDREITQDSEAEVGLGYSETEINFFEYVVTRSEESYLEIGGANNPQQIFTVEVRYTRYADPEGNNFNAVVDALETLQTIVRTSLGDSWQSTIDFIQSPQLIEAPTLQTFNETPVFRGVARFTAQKQI